MSGRKTGCLGWMAVVLVFTVSASALAQQGASAGDGNAALPGARASDSAGAMTLSLRHCHPLSAGGFSRGVRGKKDCE